MTLELDHLFICCAPGAPEAEALLKVGLAEGAGNVHPGQGTANRRFFFANAYLELLWVSDATEVESPPVWPTRIGQRSAARVAGASPFGIVLRPRAGGPVTPPFASWTYAPGYFPAGMTLEFATGTPLGEPELIFFPTARAPGEVARAPLGHTLPVQAITGVTIGLPGAPRLSAPARAVEKTGVVAYAPGEGHVVTLELDHARNGQSADLRPGLPLKLRW